jgi:uncharacterized membrane protein
MGRKRARRAAQLDIIESKKAIRSLKARADEKRTLSERAADWTSATFGSMWFLIANVVWFAIWITLNTGLVPGVEPFDPFPYGLLTMIVSLEAIILAIFVMIAQNRAARIAELREEVDLQVDLITEEELTKVLEMMCKLFDKHGIDYSNDTDLKAMLVPTNIDKLETILEEQITPGVNGAAPPEPATVREE